MVTLCTPSKKGIISIGLCGVRGQAGDPVCISTYMCSRGDKRWWLWQAGYLWNQKCKLFRKGNISV